MFHHIMSISDISEEHHGQTVTVVGVPTEFAGLSLWLQDGSAIEVTFASEVYDQYALRLHSPAVLVRGQVETYSPATDSSVRLVRLRAEHVEARQLAGITTKAC